MQQISKSDCFDGDPALKPQVKATGKRVEKGKAVFSFHFYARSKSESFIETLVFL